jgi:hypothetical protein
MAVGAYASSVPGGSSHQQRDGKPRACERDAPVGSTKKDATVVLAFVHDIRPSATHPHLHG